MQDEGGSQQTQDAEIARDEIEYWFAALLAAVSPEDRDRVLDVIRIIAIRK